MKLLIQGKPLDRYSRCLENLGLQPILHHVMTPSHKESGILLDGKFYPLWEFNEPVNAEFVRNFDLEGIRRRRVDDWSPFR